LAQVSTAVVANAGAQTSLTPGSRTVGFTATVLPLIMADNRLLLQYTLNLSSLLGLTQNSSGGQTIQTPQISSQTLQQQAYVRDGESIVLFGFEQDRKSADNSLGIVGGGSNSSRNRQAIVIVMDVARTGTR
jgi:type II secretory pathway component GspD/PulD (secretin)